MYFINTRKKLSSNTFLLHLLPAGTVLVTVLGLSLLGWRNANEALQNERQTVVNSIAQETESRLRERLRMYELVMTGGSALFLSSTEVTRGDWRTFVESFNLQEKYPGILGAGFSRYIPANQSDELARSVRQSGITSFRIFPETKNRERMVVMYFEPVSINGLGYDQLTEAERREAILHTMRTGDASITGPLQFIRNNSELGQSGFTMFLPVYADTAQTEKPPEKRVLEGVVFAPIASHSLFEAALTQVNEDQQYAIRIYDGSKDDNSRLYESMNHQAIAAGEYFANTTTLELYGRRWVIDFLVSPNMISATSRNRPVNSLVIGIMLSLLLSGFVLTLLVARTRVLAHSKQMEVQSAKDELLSLASHQLRTPATSVKQYIGMALEGFAGKLSPQQEGLLEKAYESNERQLHIINEILYVAKVDAKGIVLTPRKLNMNKLLRDLVQELSTTAKKSQQKIRLQMPRTQVSIVADEHCLRMALENLISNGLKYSHKGKTVTVKLINSRDQLQISVRDRGVGIDPGDLSQLFQRFSRIPNELSRQTSGSGIGLYLSQQLIELHNGRIDVESQKGKGTTFTVVLPKVFGKKINQ